MATVTRPKVESALPSELVDWVLSGRIRMPSFQRSYRWDTHDVTELFDSILRGYPIGNLLVWQRSAAAEVVTIGHLQIDAAERGDAYWVVDGQQRITSLVSALTATSETVDPRFRIYFDLEEGRFVSLPRRRKPADHWMPMALALNTARANAWIRARPQLDERQILLADQVVAAVRDYRIPMYVVTGDDDHALRDIFDRMNTFGKPLKSAEVFNALHSVSREHRPSDLRTLSTSVRSFGFGEFSEQVLMQSLLAIRGAKVDRDFRREFKDDSDRQDAFRTTERALGHVADFLRDVADIPHVRLLPYSLYVPVLARFVAKFGPPQGRAAELLRRWIWRGAVLGVAPQGNTVGIRQGASAVTGDPVSSADRLLRLLPTKPGQVWEPDLSQVQLNRAQAKINTLGLLSLRPRNLLKLDAHGSALDVRSILDESAVLVPIIPGLKSALGQSMANRMIHPVSRSVDLYEALTGGSIEAEILGSHCLDGSAIELLRTGDELGFLQRRAKAVREVIANHVQDRALFGFRDGPDLASLMEDMEEESGLA
ncbi:DUF262 domain-containing protein [Rhizohabitans arisaemae]|uniref:DUF262 domain-containing protein n=1 Tax=Rhizohabitans arisaemae TaxID=2720610 RepID=UPI0024B1AEEA|nr:DUF262 domain-containing protein [Rhizohabitans arisaemae]